MRFAKSPVGSSNKVTKRKTKVEGAPSLSKSKAQKGIESVKTNEVQQPKKLNKAQYKYVKMLKDQNLISKTNFKKSGVRRLRSNPNVVKLENYSILEQENDCDISEHDALEGVLDIRVETEKHDTEQKITQGNLSEYQKEIDIGNFGSRKMSQSSVGGGPKKPPISSQSVFYIQKQKQVKQQYQMDTTMKSG